MPKSVFSLLLALLFSLTSRAGVTLNSQCTKNSVGGLTEGLNINTPYTIASVSKVFTTHWAINRLGPQYRFATKVHIASVGINIFDVHMQGSLFPYFDKDMYQFLVGELNKLGIKQIRNLTYDESFLYSTDVRYNALLAHGNDDQNIIQIMKDLRHDTLTLNSDLAALNAKALDVEKLKLPDSLNLSIRDIHFLSAIDFFPTSDTHSFSLKSSELFRNLKEMNRNSHNFAADKIYKKLSEKENYRDFIETRLVNVRPDEINLYNGSGYPLVLNSNKVYNEASCAAVLEMMADLRILMLSAGLDFKDVLPVAGKDNSADGDSSVTKIYGSVQTSGVLIAKTGSVIDTIALAGLIMTENENTFFQTSFKVDANPEDRVMAYNNIKSWLANELIKDKKKSELDQYQPKIFLPFDGRSGLQPIDSFRLLN